MSQTCQAIKTNSEQCTCKAILLTHENLNVCGRHKDFINDDIQKIKTKQENEIKKKNIEEQNEILLKLPENIGKIPLKNKNGEISDWTIVSSNRYEDVMKYKWHKVVGGYVAGYINNIQTRLTHYLLGKPEESQVIDHINNNILDNRTENLRFTTRSQNSQNKNKKKNTKRNYIGVYQCGEKWFCNSGNVYLGCYDNEIEAAKKYDTYVLLKYGKDASTNNLVNYQDIKHININTLIVKKQERDLPKYICKYKNIFSVRIKYNKQKYFSYEDTLEKAIEKVKEFEHEIQQIKDQERKNHFAKPILRNNDDKAIIIASNNHNEQCIVSDNKWHDLSQYKWMINKTGYYRGTINGKNIIMHRYIMNAKDDEIIDHINHNRSDNSNENLRIITASGNAHNKKKQKNTSSKYIGVHKHSKKWRAIIYKNTIKNNIGNFVTEIEAAIAYNIKAKELYGEYANLNDISDEDYNKYSDEIYKKIK